jgi:hypothetical protein
MPDGAAQRSQKVLVTRPRLDWPVPVSLLTLCRFGQRLPLLVRWRCQLFPTCWSRPWHMTIMLHCVRPAYPPPWHRAPVAGPSATDDICREVTIRLHALRIPMRRMLGQIPQVCDLVGNLD